MNCLEFLLYLLMFFFPSLIEAQFIDHFDDNELDSNPAWNGDKSKFKVINNRLHLQAAAVSGTASLSTPAQVGLSTQWEFSFQLDFNPSSANYLKVYLISDNENLYGPLHGYFIKAGELSDDVSLFRQNGTEEVRIIDGQDGRLNLSSVTARVRVSRDQHGDWQLFTDVGLTGNWTLEGQTNDLEISSATHFGIFCVYTATRSDKFWLDDFEVREIPVIDTDPPTLTGVKPVPDHYLTLEFSEAIELNSAQSLDNFQLAGQGMPLQAVLSKEQQSVSLTFEKPFVSGEYYEIIIKAISDEIGNIAQEIHSWFLYYIETPTGWKDIMFTEILADPQPLIGMPDGEFIELYNRSSYPKNLTGWYLSDGHSTTRFPELILHPEEYIIVTSAGSKPFFEKFGAVVGLENFPTLNNAGDLLLLRSKEGTLMDSLSYDMGWYRDDDKKEGGWSLELIDPSNPCGDEDNWTASENLEGGTPGKQNSVFGSKPDLVGPVIENIEAISPTTVVCRFNEKLSLSSLTDGKFGLTPTRSLLRATFEDSGRRSIKLEWIEALSFGEFYELSVHDIADCNGNRSENSISFGLPEKTMPGDVLINEILFNPRSGGVDFVEFYNAADKFLTTSGWKIGNWEDGVAVNLHRISNGRLIEPHSYAVFTVDPLVVKMQYPSRDEERLLFSQLPGLADDEGSVVILNDIDSIIDEVSYSRQWHSPFIQDDEGVSLERISWKSPSTSRDNWASASSTVGFATPGIMNSQQREHVSIAEGEVTILPEIFSPMDGSVGYAQIMYRFDQPGMLVNVSVFDPQGRHLKTIASNEIIGWEGFFHWGGDHDSGQMVRSGYYLLRFEAFDDQGNVKVFRKRVVVYRP